MGDWKGVRLTGPMGSENSTELYDLASDPAELRDVAGSHPDVVAQLVQLMREAHAPSDLFPFPGERP